MSISFRKNNIPLFAICLASISVFVSCLKNNDDRSTPSISCNKVSIELPGDSGSDALHLDSLLVNCNRSWTAYVVYVSPSGEEQQWLDISLKENCNFSEIYENNKIFIMSSNNVSDKDRIAKIAFYCQGIKEAKYVDVKQAGLTYRIACSPEIIPDIDYKGAESYFGVDSNIPWHAEVVSGNFDDIKLINDRGKGMGKVEFEISENPEAEERQWEVRVLPDEGYESSNSFNVKIYQLAAEPYLELDTQSSDTIIRGDEEEAKVYFRTNADWTAELKDASSGVNLQKKSGTKSDKFVSVLFGKNTTPNIKKTATVVLSVGNETSSIDIVQYGYITLYFSDGATYISKSIWPFSSPSYIGTSAEYINTVTPFVHNDGYTYIVKMTNGLKRNSKGLYFMGTTNDYIEFPSFPDCKIVAVSVTESGAGKKRKITDVDGNVVSGGETQTCAAGVAQTWLLSDSKNGTPYRFTFHSANMSAIIREISVYYE